MLITSGEWEIPFVCEAPSPGKMKESPTCMMSWSIIHNPTLCTTCVIDAKIYNVTLLMVY